MKINDEKISGLLDLAEALIELFSFSLIAIVISISALSSTVPSAILAVILVALIFFFKIKAKFKLIDVRCALLPESEHQNKNKDKGNQSSPSGHE